MTRVMTATRITPAAARADDDHRCGIGRLRSGSRASGRLLTWRCELASPGDVEIIGRGGTRTSLRLGLACNPSGGRGGMSKSSGVVSWRFAGEQVWRAGSWRRRFRCRARGLIQDLRHWLIVNDERHWESSTFGAGGFGGVAVRRGGGAFTASQAKGHLALGAVDHLSGGRVVDVNPVCSRAC